MLKKAALLLIFVLILSGCRANSKQESRTDTPEETVVALVEAILYMNDSTVAKDILGDRKSVV